MLQTLRVQYLSSSQVHEEALFLKDLSEGKRVVDIYDYYEKNQHSLLVLEYLEVRVYNFCVLGFIFKKIDLNIILTISKFM